MDKYFFTIPVYRLTSDKYYEELEKHISDNLYKGQDKEFIEKFYANNPSHKIHAEDHLRTTYGGCWELNEIIGFIKLHFVGLQVRGEYWSVNAKKIVRTRKKQFVYKTHKLAPEIGFHIDESNQGIFECICKYIDTCKKELKNRYIDDSEFQTIGQCIDWNKLISTST